MNSNYLYRICKYNKNQNIDVINYINKLDDIKIILDVSSYDINQLFIMLKNYDINKCKLLITYCNKYNIPFDKNTAFISAYSNRNLNIAKILIQYSNSINDKINIDDLFFQACYEKNLKHANSIIEYATIRGENPNRLNNSIEYMILKSNSTDIGIVEYLLLNTKSIKSKILYTCNYVVLKAINLFTNNNSEKLKKNIYMIL